MGFSGIGTGEILLVIVLALIIWGPNKMPEIARTMGKALRTLRKTTSDLTTTMTKEIEQQEIGTPPSHLKETPGDKTEKSSSDVAKTRVRRSNVPPKNPEGHQQ